METSFSIDNQRFTLLGLQRGGAAVYRGDAGAYLRLADVATITRDLGLHRAMERAKFPVAPILSEGSLGSDLYFIEKSLGTRSFGVIFEEDCNAVREIQKEHLDAFIAVLKRLYAAQLKASVPTWNTEEFAEGIRLPLLMRELPQFATSLRETFAAVCNRLRKLPGTLTHGDCNPANVYAGGIIDLEDSFHGPIGYDIIAALVTIEWSPITREYEFFARYRFTPEARAHFLHTFDILTKRAKLPLASSTLRDFSFCRAVWLCSGMGEWPRIQQWRYEKLIASYLSEE